MSWTLFSVSEIALGGIYANVFRMTTKALTVIVTILYNKWRDKLRVTCDNLLVNKLLAQNP